jgi:two-component system LytT family response regulator
MIKYVIIDDEEKSIDTLSFMLKKYCEYDIEEEGVATNISDAYNLIKTQKPDLVFLDIEMPFGSGFDLLEKFDSLNFQVIFTTGFDHYAISAIKFSALDYLLKPISINELNIAVKKAIVKIEEKTGFDNLYHILQNLKYPRHNSNKIPLPSINGLDMVSVDQIIYCQADEDYTQIFFKDGSRKVVTKSIKEFEEILIHYDFFRVHHSYLINKSYIKKYTKGEGGTITTDLGHEIPVSRRKKPEFLHWVNEI